MIGFAALLPSPRDSLHRLDSENRTKNCLYDAAGGGAVSYWLVRLFFFPATFCVDRG